MHKILILSLTLIGSVYGMDGGSEPRGQEGYQLDLEALSQDSADLFAKVPTDHFPIIEDYRVARKHQELDKILENILSAKEVIKLGEADKECKRAPLTLYLSNEEDDEVNDAVIKKITDLFPKLKSLILFTPIITDAGLEHLKSLTNLTHLDLGGPTSITNAGLVHLKGIINLKSLKLSDFWITDAGLQHLKSLTNLTELKLWSLGITDARLQHLKSLTNLTKLTLIDSGITDAGLQHLKSLTNLKELNFGRARVTEAGKRELQQALPNCKIAIY